MIKNPTQLKALLNNIAKAKGISPQSVLQRYFMERLLDRIAMSAYRKNFILKGGLLISAVVGIDVRTTMDIDTTTRGIEPTRENIERIFIEICAICLDDDFGFSINRLTDIRGSNDQPGVRLHLRVSFHSIKGWLSVDVTAGDEITPEAIEYCIPTILGDTSIQVFAYNLETILAEKLETIVSRGIANTRPRDFYDVYVFIKEKENDINLIILSSAIRATSSKRGSVNAINNHKAIIASIKIDPEMIERWEKYRSSYCQVQNISFAEVCDCVDKLMDKLER